ncbi:Vegetative incompatibility protein HET-E-1 [Madurella mycetomatis]|uniref:Vegetative incompatibility protein HET-E-1 n=1 Tax=Madurella mycetomatis TaxID=100816 RepID=A0A175WC83_9PEZI|nr:Vegetative incompatibility protein HET-E-1 [Madurella mycetomatis]KXX81101.1 Vegetative incompatibility protein HET-E-1 [Madurella mycetomatis]
MEAIVAVSLAASIINFIDFLMKLVRGTYEVYASPAGTADENAHVSNVLDDLYDITKNLATEFKAGDKHERALARLGRQCVSLSEELQQILQTLKAKDASRWESARVKLKSMRKDKDIVTIEKRLGEYKAELLLRLSFMMGQNAVQTRLDKLQSEGLRLSSESASQLDGIRAELRRILEELRSASSSATAVHPVQQSPSAGTPTETDTGTEQPIAKAGATDTDELPRLGNLLNDLQSLAGTLPKENFILSRLYFDSMHQREDSVSDPEYGTFRWIVDIGSEVTTGGGVSLTEPSDWSTLSGKSTLMKYLAQEEKVKQELLMWAGKKRLCLGNFFFCNSGDSLQTSLEGLLRSILFETLRNCPRLISKIFPGDWDTNGILQVGNVPFRLKELQEAMQRLLSTTTFPYHRFCFFIDGLDEYKGDYVGHLDLARRLQEWRECDDVKVICSSRPHIAFTDTFRSPDRVLQLQQLTRSDIRKFVLIQVKKQIKERYCEEPGDGYTEIVNEILDMADGVFLWARLVTRSVVAGIAHGDSVHALQERVKSTPRDLDSLFAKMLSTVEPAGQERSRKMLRLALNNPFNSPLCALDFSWLDDLDRGTFPSDAQDEPYTDEEVEKRCQLVRRQLAAYTCGRLETNEYNSKPVTISKAGLGLSGEKTLEKEWIPQISTFI